MGLLFRVYGRITVRGNVRVRSKVRVRVKARVYVIFLLLVFGVKDLSCNIYGLVFNVRILVFWALDLGFRV